MTNTNYTRPKATEPDPIETDAWVIYITGF